VPVGARSTARVFVLARLRISPGAAGEELLGLREIAMGVDRLVELDRSQQLAVVPTQVVSPRVFGLGRRS